MVLRGQMPGRAVMGWGTKRILEVLVAGRRVWGGRDGVADDVMSTRSDGCYFGRGGW